VHTSELSFRYVHAITLPPYCKHSQPAPCASAWL
jgi:hypothetical protein